MAAWIPVPKTSAAETLSSGRLATWRKKYFSGHDRNVEMADHEIESRPGEGSGDLVVGVRAGGGDDGQEFGPGDHRAPPWVA